MTNRRVRNYPKPYSRGGANIIVKTKVNWNGKTNKAKQQTSYGIVFLLCLSLLENGVSQL